LEIVMSVLELVVQSVVKPFRAKTFRSALSVLTVIGATFVGATVASADSTQVQSYQRASASEACVAQRGETPWQASWGTDSSWKPSWEQWASNGTGGWVCTRSIAWLKTPAVTYRLGDIGPGDGMVFLISGGLTYEMAPNTWSGSSDPSLTWCDGPTDVPAASGTAVGTGAANTAAMAASNECSSNAAAAVLAYAPAGSRAGQWFLPSKDELNAMCNYSRVPTAPAAPSVSCDGSDGTSQDGTFAVSSYGFGVGRYWTSSQRDASRTLSQCLGSGLADWDDKVDAVWVRPIRAFSGSSEMNVGLGSPGRADSPCGG
jgi:hypothetical protein